MMKKRKAHCCSVCGEIGHNKFKHFPGLKAKEPKRCSACGGSDHTSTNHIHLKEKECVKCKQVKPVDKFPHVKRKRKSGNIVTVIWSICFECNRIECKRRYRTLKTRLNSLVYRSHQRQRHTKGNGHKIASVITLEEVISLYHQQEGRCYYTGRLLSLETGNDSISIDRKDPSKPYELSNVVLTSNLVNRMKTDIAESDFYDLCKLISDHHQAR